MNGKGRDHALDGMRGWAAMAVVLSHVAAMSWNPFFEKGSPDAWQYVLWHLGAPAVDLFFVLSGYVVAASLIRRGPLRDLPAYWTARAMRLLPIAWIGVGAGLAWRALPLSMPADASAALALRDQPVPLRDALSYLMMVRLPVDVTLINPVLWTTFAEVKASIVIPFMTWMTVRIREIAIPLIAAMAFGMAVATGQVIYLLMTPFALGAVLATREVRLPIGGARVLAGLSLVVLMSRHLLGEQGEMFRLVTMFGAAGLIVAIRSGVAQDMLRHRLSAFLGDLSYPLYAIHYPVMATAVMALSGSAAWNVTLAALVSIPISIVASWGVAVWIDARLIRASSGIRRRHVVADRG